VLHATRVKDIKNNLERGIRSVSALVLQIRIR